jgi:deoxyribodipyrimidine photo-lyase
MSAARRTRSNPALEHAVGLCRAWKRPLLVLEALRCGYRWASARHHAFVIEGMRDNAAACAAAGVAYYPWVEPESGMGKGLIGALAAHAAAVVSDEWPGFFLPRAVQAAARSSPTRFETVDGCGLLPLRATPGAFQRAYDFRRFLQKHLVAHLQQTPSVEPLALLPALPPATVPEWIRKRWPPASMRLLSGDALEFGRLPIDPTVQRSDMRGGARAAAEQLHWFTTHGLQRYAADRSDPDVPAASGLSPYLHYGHIGSHEVLAALSVIENWTPARVSGLSVGKKEGWWGMSPGAESFLDELVTWRELGLNFSHHRADQDSYAALPAWALATLEQHARDRREHVYELPEFESAQTHDALWNAAQRELVRTGSMHNYMRMLWGKKVLHWTREPRRAFEILVELNNKYALDGRDPNSYSGIAWCFGRYDRPWAPQRPIFGSVRYMSSENTARKYSVKAYLKRNAVDHSDLPFG